MLKVRNLFPRYWEATSLKKMAQHRTLPSQSRIPVAALRVLRQFCRETVSPSFSAELFVILSIQPFETSPLNLAISDHPAPFCSFLRGQNVLVFSHLPRSGRDQLGSRPTTALLWMLDQPRHIGWQQRLQPDRLCRPALSRIRGHVRRRECRGQSKCCFLSTIFAHG